MGFFMVHDKLTLKFMWKNEEPRLAKTLERTTRIGDILITYPSFQNY